MREPTKKDLLDELRRLKAENERLKRLVQSQRPELKRLRHVATGLRHYLDNGPRQLQRVFDELTALLPEGDADLPKVAELSGIWSRGKARVDAALNKP